VAPFLVFVSLSFKSVTLHYLRYETKAKGNSRWSVVASALPAAVSKANGARYRRAERLTRGKVGTTTWTIAHIVLGCTIAIDGTMVFVLKGSQFGMYVLRNILTADD
jgi:hypothetical protein